VCLYRRVRDDDCLKGSLQHPGYPTFLDTSNKPAPFRDPIAKGKVVQAQRVDAVGVEDASGLVVIDEAPMAAGIDELQMRLADGLKDLFSRESASTIGTTAHVLSFGQLVRCRAHLLPHAEHFRLV
jgi:hypothetical protein